METFIAVAKVNIAIPCEFANVEFGVPAAPDAVPLKA
jgi:hypothetical protein